MMVDRLRVHSTDTVSQSVKAKKEDGLSVSLSVIDFVDVDVVVMVPLVQLVLVAAK